MKTKMLLLATLLFTFGVSKAQITPPFPIPDKIPEYDGTYEDFGQGHLFYPNDGEIRFNDKDQSDARDVVKYYTMYTHPRKYLMNNNNISFVYFKRDDPAAVDSLHRADVEMYNSDPSAFLARVDTQTKSTLNYFTQWFSSSGRVNVQGGAAIACQSIWRNIDLVYTSNNVGLKMYFIVYPGGDLKDIILHIKDSKANTIIGNKLRFYANWDSTTFIRPHMYQYSISGSVITPVNVCPASWQSLGGDKYGITTSGSINSALPVIVEVQEGVQATASTPGLKWSTYFGGNVRDDIIKTHIDGNDNLYVAGTSESSYFPSTGGPVLTTAYSYNSDGFISKFSPGGALLWSAFVGGSLHEYIEDFDFKGTDIYCVGATMSSNLVPQPKTGALNQSSFGGGHDGFIFQIGFLSNGTMVNKWLTYFGGNGTEYFFGCKFDRGGNFFATGLGNSTNMTPVGVTGAYVKNYNPAQQITPAPLIYDGIIAKFDSTTSNLKWFTFYGTDSLGTNANANANDRLIGIDTLGSSLYVCGYAGGLNLPGKLNSKYVPNNTDGVLARFSTGGALIESKYTEGNIVNNALKTNGTWVYVVGQADTTMNTLDATQIFYDDTCAGNSDASLIIYDQNISTLKHCTFIGGNSDDAATDIAFTNNTFGLGSSPLFYIAGGTSSNNYPVPTLTGMYQQSYAGNFDNFITSLQWGRTYIPWGACLGSAQAETFGIGFGTSIALTSQNVLHLAGNSQSPNSYPLDSLAGAYFQNQKNTSSPTDRTGTVTRFDAMTTMVGLKDFPNTKFSFGIYPNPTSSYLVVDNKELLSQTLSYAVYDMQGRKLSEGKINTSEQNKIDVSALNNGIYIVNVSNGKRTFSNKFIKRNE